MKKNLISLITMWKGSWAALVLLLVFFSFSCSKDKGDKKAEISNTSIIGAWYLSSAKEYEQPNGGAKVQTDDDGEDPSETIQFKNNGTFTRTWSEGNANGVFTLKGNSLYMKYNDVKEYGEATLTVLQLDNTTLRTEYKELNTELDSDGTIGTYFYEETWKKK